jgi:hypothetical protein
MLLFSELAEQQHPEEPEHWRGQDCHAANHKPPIVSPYAIDTTDAKTKTQWQEQRLSQHITEHIAQVGSCGDKPTDVGGALLYVSVVGEARHRCFHDGRRVGTSSRGCVDPVFLSQAPQRDATALLHTLRVRVRAQRRHEHLR